MLRLVSVVIDIVTVALLSRAACVIFAKARLINHAEHIRSQTTHVTVLLEVFYLPWTPSSGLQSLGKNAGEKANESWLVSNGLRRIYFLASNANRFTKGNN